MAELDFAFIAEYARQEPTGVMSVLGLNLTHMWVQEYPARVLIHIVGRAWMEPGEPATQVSVKIVGPDESFELEIERSIAPPASEPVLEGRQAAPIMVPVLVPLLGPGLYVCLLSLGDAEVARLTFESGIGALRTAAS